MSRRTSGLRILRYFYDASKLGQAPYFPVTNFDAMIKYYDSNFGRVQNEGFVEIMGRNAELYSDKSLKLAMERVAKKYPATYPSAGAFSQEITKEPLATPGTLEILSNAGREVVEDLGTFANFSLYGIAIVLIIVGGVLAYQKGGGKLPAIKGFK